MTPQRRPSPAARSLALPMLLALLAPMTAVAACGGATDVDLLSSEGSSTFGSNPPGSSGNDDGSSGKTRNPGDPDDPSEPGDPGDPPDPPPPPKDSGTDAAIVDAGPDVKDSSVADAKVDSGLDGGTTPGIPCARANSTAMYCEAREEVCCVRRNKTFTCEDADKLIECVGGRTFACNDKSDCEGGKVCCATTGNLANGNSECRPSCDPSPVPSQTVVRLCDPSAPVDECATINQKCAGTLGVDGFHICK